ncbi:MAG: TolC family protein, partial [Nitrospiraceae bacterium]
MAAGHAAVLPFRYGQPGSLVATPPASGRLKLTVVIVGVGLLLAGCMMGPDYKRPDTPAGEAWRVAPATSESIANLPWWELLKDPELHQLIRTALLENLDLQIATANIEEFQAQLMIAKFDLIPSFTYSGHVFGFRNTNTSAFPVPGGGAVPTSGKNGITLSHEAASVGLKWELDLWGRIRRSIEAARAQLLSKQEN